MPRFPLSNDEVEFCNPLGSKAKKHKLGKICRELVHRVYFRGRSRGGGGGGGYTPLPRHGQPIGPPSILPDCFISSLPVNMLRTQTCWLITPRAHARARGYVIGRGVYYIYIIIYYYILYICKTFFYLSKYSLSEVYFNTDRLLIEFNGLWYSLAARQVFVAIANPDSLSFG